jgi:spore coat protein U-like protein
VRIQLRLLFVLGLFFLVSHQAAACGGLDMTLTTAAYNLNTNNNPALTINVTRNNDNQACSYFVAIDYGSGSSYSDRRLLNGAFQFPIQIYENVSHTNIVKSLADSSSNADVLEGSFAVGNGITSQFQTFYPSIDPSGYGRFGLYSDTYNVTLYEGTVGNSPNNRRVRTLNLQYTQAKKIDLSLVDTGGSFNAADTNQLMDFAELSAGESLSCDLVLGYNAGYQIKMNSVNLGKLKHTLLPQTISYTMTVNGSSVNLGTANITVATGTGVSPAGGLRLPITATIGSLLGKQGGTYKDTITVTVTSTE